MNKYSYKKMMETGEIPPEIKEAMDRVNRLYDAWHSKQEKDFMDNKKAIQPHMAERAKLVPPNFKRFWKWYLDYCGEYDFDLSREIEPRDFVLYDKWERKQMYDTPIPTEDEKLNPKVCALALAIAFKSKGITQEVANSKKAVIALADELFSFNPAGVYDHWRHFKNYKIENLEILPEFDRAKELFEKHFR